MPERTITVTIDTEAWDNMVEGFGDGSTRWDTDDVEHVFEKVINPVSAAIERKGRQ